ncbi:MAG: GLPGLI family protein [Saprospiraceae bacterium]|nr:GLPGLI family protein [Saprospiraceae bacterium]
MQGHLNYLTASIFFIVCTSLTGFGQIENSKAIGQVIYHQQADLLEGKNTNGISYLFFNTSASLYVQTGAPESALITQNLEDFSYNSGDKLDFSIYKDHRARKIWFSTFCYKRELGSHCVVEDTLGATEWLIDHSAHKRFGTYQCLKATGHFRGRDYEVWFTPDIPISSGPFKLGGLPGLILEGRSTDGLVQFIFQRLELSPDLPRKIQKPEGFYTGLSYEENKKAFVDNVKKIAEELNAEGGAQITVGEMPANAWIEVW